MGYNEYVCMSEYVNIGVSQAGVSRTGLSSLGRSHNMLQSLCDT